MVRVMWHLWCRGISGFSRKPLVTLRDAAEYITQLPEAEHGFGWRRWWRSDGAAHRDDACVAKGATSRRKRAKVYKITELIVMSAVLYGPPV
jgi:hypothetical protein